MTAPQVALRFLLDTGILVHYIRGSILGRRIESSYHLSVVTLAPIISVVTLGEIHALALKWGWKDAKQRQLEELVQSLVPVPLEFPGIIDAYARIDNHSRRSGISMGKNDLWIAATAHVTGARLVTIDKDFDHLDPAFLRRDWIDPAKD